MRAQKGFTLVEILIVVVILGILAAIVIPQFTDASNEARDSSVASNLHALRSQIELFEIRTGAYPATLQAMVDANYMQSVPVHPYVSNSETWIYVAATGRLTSSNDPNL